MTSEQWQQIKEIFDAAQERTGAERAAYLAATCSGDEELKREIESLLASHDKAEGFIENPVFVAKDEETRKFLGHHIGPYKIISEIGRGGMGVVFHAERDDAEFHQRVALKLIRRGLDTEDVLRRFRNERQILAALNHPNVARLLDGGSTDTGLPYFVMEYIEGLPLLAYCNKSDLDIEQRIKLFQKVCEAVAYAHQNLIIHRDLKPSNILVTNDGEPKLLDFGVGKFLAPDFADERLAQTATALRAMTPEYASPEQIRGLHVTTSTDIYSLGVVLYELLTGSRPYNVTSHQPDEIAKAICESEPTKPSQAGSRQWSLVSGDAQRAKGEEQSANSGERLATDDGQKANLKSLRGDLDNIILMALRKEPQRRYATVEQLNEDLRRNLEGLPVIARQDTLSYRTTKFVQRHKMGVAAAALVVISLIGGLAATLWQSRVARAERDRARLAQAKAERINAFLREMLSSANPSTYNLGQGKGRDVTVVQALGEAAKRIDTELAEQPELKAELHQTIGIAYLDLGLGAAAEPHLQAALELWRQLFGEADLKFAESLYSLGGLQFYFKGDYTGAEQTYRRALAIQRAQPQQNEFVAQLLQNVADAVHWKGDPLAAEPLFREALALRRQQYGNNHIMVSVILYELGSCRNSLGDIDGALALYQEALAVYQQAQIKPPGEAYWLTQALSSAYTLKGEYEKAEPLLRQALESQRRIRGENHPGVALSRTQLAELLYRQRHNLEARGEISEAIETQRRILAEGHPSLAYSLSISGLILTRLGEHARAEAQLREALNIQRRRLLKGHWHTSITLGALGECLQARKQYADAESLLIESYESFKANQGEEYPRTVEARERLANLYQAWPITSKPTRNSAEVLN